MILLVMHNFKKLQHIKPQQVEPQMYYITLSNIMTFYWY